MKKKNNKGRLQPKIVGNVHDTPVSTKKRISAFILLGFMIFWTIGSAVACWLAFFDNKKDSAMITASAAPAVDDAASNNQAFEIFLDGFTSANYNWYNDNVGQYQESLFGYRTSFFYQPSVGFSLCFYHFENRLGDLTSYKDVPAFSKPFTNVPTYFTLDMYDGQDQPFMVQWLSGSSHPYIGEIPVQVNYVSTNLTFQGGSYSGYTCSLIFLTSAGSLREYRLFFGVHGNNFTSGLMSVGESFFSVPMAPLTYEQFIAYNLNADTIDSLRDQIRELQSENNQLQREFNNAFNNGVSQGYSDGYSEGYETGKIAGAAGSNDYSFFALISSVVDVPVQTFSSLFNFELLGFNLLNFFLGVITCALIIKLLKMFL